MPTGVFGAVCTSGPIFPQLPRHPQLHVLLGGGLCLLPRCRSRGALPAKVPSPLQWGSHQETLTPRPDSEKKHWHFLRSLPHGVGLYPTFPEMKLKNTQCPVRKELGETRRRTCLITWTEELIWVSTVLGRWRCQWGTLYYRAWQCGAVLGEKQIRADSHCSFQFGHSTGQEIEKGRFVFLFFSSSPSLLFHQYWRTIFCFSDQIQRISYQRTRSPLHHSLSYCKYS